MAASGEFSCPSPGNSQWPLTHGIAQSATQPGQRSRLTRTFGVEVNGREPSCLCIAMYGSQPSDLIAMESVRISPGHLRQDWHRPAGIGPTTGCELSDEPL